MYVIPENYMNSGKLFNGLISTRNALETAILVPLLVFLEFTFIPATGYALLVIVLVTGLPLLVVTAFGIAGDSFLQRMGIIIRHFRRKRKLHFKR